ncbi:MAG TPA: vitamin K epoxide reductase family protein [Gemmatimonadaceae bacterium]|nr:vitamin K epoxide reductase family protein [Gemmatimonadaceae bacterium]
MTLRTFDRLRLALSVGGLVVAGYLTLLHYNRDVPLVCSHNGIVDCATVLGSPAAMLFGFPVAAWGLLWFAGAVVLAIASLRALRRGHRDPVRGVALAYVLGGTAFILYLLYQELGVIGRICAWCTVVHVIVLALLVVQVLSDPMRAPGRD